MSLSTDHQNIENKIKVLLSETLRKGEMNVRDVVILCAILGQAENADELKRLTKIFVEDYPILNSFVSIEEETAHDEIETQVEKFIKELMQTNPVRAVAIAKDVTQKNVKLEDLKNKYPDFKMWLESKLVSE